MKRDGNLNKSHRRHTDDYKRKHAHEHVEDNKKIDEIIDESILNGILPNLSMRELRNGEREQAKRMCLDSFRK